MEKIGSEHVAEINANMERLAQYNLQHELDLSKEKTIKEIYEKGNSEGVTGK